MMKDWRRATSRLGWGGALLGLLLILVGCGHGAYRSDLPAVHVVARGETLYSIAQRYGVSVDYLIFRNQLQPPYTIYVGQKVALQRQIQPGEDAWLGKKPGDGVAAAVASSAAPPAQTGAAAPRGDTQKSGMTPASEMLWPVEGGGTIVRGFDRKGREKHDGLDIAAEEGTAVLAAADGEVIYSGDGLTGYGNLILVRHAGDIVSAYAHNRRNLVKKGDKVTRGQTIAQVGDTGRASGPHLHFEIREGVTPTDPLRWVARP